MGHVTFRDSVYKDKYFIEYLGGLTWRRRPGEPEREVKVLLGLLFELKFGG